MSKSLDSYGGIERYRNLSPRQGRISRENGEWINEADNNPTTDLSGRAKINGVFGGSLMLQREPTASLNFTYGADTRRTVDNSADGGSYGFDGNLLTVSTGTDAAGIGSVQTKRNLRYIAGKDAEGMGTAIFDTPVEDNEQWLGVFDDDNGFAIGYNSLEFGVMRRKSGTTTFTKQEDFSEDALDGNGISGFNIDPQKMNVFRIVYGYLGIATIYYEVYDGDKFITFHKTKLTNTQAETHIANPYLPMRIEVKNTGNETDITLKSGSAYIGVLDGGNSPDVSQRPFAYKRTSIEIVSGENNILATFFNKETFNTYSNKIEALLATVGLGVEANKPLNLSVWKTSIAPLAGTFADIDTDNSTLQVATDANPVVGTAQLIDTFAIGSKGQINAEVSNRRILLFPGEYAFFTYSTPAGASGDITFGISWQELF